MHIGGIHGDHALLHAEHVYAQILGEIFEQGAVCSVVQNNMLHRLHHRMYAPQIPQLLLSFQDRLLMH